MKRFLLGGVVSLTAPRWTGRLFAEVGESSPGPAKVVLKLVEFPPLQTTGGSVQVNFSLFAKPFTVNRISATEWVVLDSVCTHNGCTVGKFDAANGYMRCPCHGSRYDIAGRVFRDADGNPTEPAQADIARFASVHDATAGTLEISIPGLALAVKSISVHHRENAPQRMKIEFFMTANSTYEIHHSASLQDGFKRVAFSLTPDGATDQVSIQTPAAGVTTQAVYVDANGPRGFYVVMLVLRSV